MINKLIVNGEIIEEPKKISNSFLAYFRELYKENQEKMDKFLNQNKLWKISKEEAAPISMIEIQQAMKKMKVGLGPERLPAKYYKKVEELLSLPFKDNIFKM